MLSKKSKRANLEKKRFIFFQIGLIMTLAAVLMAFEWKTFDEFVLDERIIERDWAIEELPDIIPPDQPEPEPQTPPPTFTDFNIEDDDVDIDTEIDIDASDLGENVEVEDIWQPPDDDEGEVIDDVPVYIAQEMPSFPGGESARAKYLKANVVYPEMAKQAGIKGSVYINFIVERDGSLSNIKLARGIGGGCDEEALRVVYKMPKWSPGKQNGRPVRVQMNMPVKFTLL